ncbi:unnamed protein product, partial [Mesorhabditis belari]|uniref:Uncharacterized protein n=1 Tax=Mesorhabditis belari TaxID=2138241 RepID=A0AAF3F3Q8_9BILA
MSRRPVDFLTPRETFEHYEQNRSPSSAGSIAPAAPPRAPSREVHEYRSKTQMYTTNQPNAQLACEYRAAPPQPQLACEYRADPHFNGTGSTIGESTRITSTFMPNKKKIPMGWLIGGVICLPILLAIILFGAVWLQELGIL